MTVSKKGLRCIFAPSFARKENQVQWKRAQFLEGILSWAFFEILTGQSHLEGFTVYTVEPVPRPTCLQLQEPVFQDSVLSRCRTFNLQNLTVSDIRTILERALEVECPGHTRSPVLDTEMIAYLSTFAAGDARTALNLLELAINLSIRIDITKDDIKKSMTQTPAYVNSGTVVMTSCPPFISPSEAAIQMPLSTIWLGCSSVARTLCGLPVISY